MDPQSPLYVGSEPSPLSVPPELLDRPLPPPPRPFASMLATRLKMTRRIAITFLRNFFLLLGTTMIFLNFVLDQTNTR